MERVNNQVELSYSSVWLTFTSGLRVSSLVVTSGSAPRTCCSLETFSNCSPSMETLCFTTSLKLPLCTNLGVWRRKDFKAIVFSMMISQSTNAKRVTKSIRQC